MKGMTCMYLLLFCLSCTAALGQYEAIQPQGIYSSEFNIDNIPRHITYYMPLQYGSQSAYPLVVVLHDAGSSAAGTIKKWGDEIHALADSLGSVVLYPEAVNNRWNSNPADTTAGTANDVGFIGIMTDFFIQQFQCDATRLFILGMGNGGELAWLAHCQRPGKYAAIAALQAAALPDCPSTTPALQLPPQTNIKEALARAWKFIASYRKTE